jgi:hypothetical protein
MKLFFHGFLPTHPNYKLKLRSRFTINELHSAILRIKNLFQFSWVVASVGSSSCLLVFVVFQNGFIMAMDHKPVIKSEPVDISYEEETKTAPIDQPIQNGLDDEVAAEVTLSLYNYLYNMFSIMSSCCGQTRIPTSVGCCSVSVKFKT